MERFQLVEQLPVAFRMFTRNYWSGPGVLIHGRAPRDRGRIAGALLLEIAGTAPRYKAAADCPDGRMR